MASEPTDLSMILVRVGLDPDGAPPSGCSRCAESEGEGDGGEEEGAEQRRLGREYPRSRSFTRLGMAAIPYFPCSSRILSCYSPFKEPNYGFGQASSGLRVAHPLFLDGSLLPQGMETHSQTSLRTYSIIRSLHHSTARARTRTCPEDKSHGSQGMRREDPCCMPSNIYNSACPRYYTKESDSLPDPTWYHSVTRPQAED
jgi:hypothetical protein